MMNAYSSSPQLYYYPHSFHILQLILFMRDQRAQGIQVNRYVGEARFKVGVELRTVDLWDGN